MNFSVNTEKNQNLTKALTYGGWIFLVLSPVLLLLIQSLLCGTNLFLGVPVWSDELDYWREMYSFSNNGFEFGGSLFVGMDATVGPMGAHSFSPIAAWGLLCWLFRGAFGPYAIVWSNLFLLTIAWLIFVLLVKPSLQMLLAANGVAYLFPMTILYLHSSMIEIVCMAGIIVYVALFYRWERDERNIWFVLLMLVGVWCVCVRVTYIVILFPAIWRKNKFKFSISTLISMVSYLIIFAVFYKVYNLFCAGYPGWTTEKISNAQGIVSKLKVIIYNTKDNLIRLINPLSADRAQVGMRYFYLAIIVVLLLLIVEELILPVLKDKGGVDYLYISLFIMMTGLLVMMVCLYDIKDWRDFRTFAPIALGVFMLVVLRNEGKKQIQIILWSLFALCFVMFLTSGVNFVKLKGEQKFKDISSSFEMLELEDENNNPRTIGVDKELNWCDISVMGSIPSKLGVQIFYDEISDENINDVDYIFVSNNDYDSNTDLYRQYEIVSEVSEYGYIIKTGK